NAPVALRTGTIKQMGEERNNAPIIHAEVTSNEDIEKQFDQTLAHFGGKVNFILHSVGMSINVRKGIPYTENNYDFMHKAFDISAISLYRVLATAMKKDAINDGGSVVALTYIAAQRVFPDYNDMADAKALLESITRNFG